MPTTSTSKRKPTPRQDCEEIAARLTPKEELAAALKTACGEYLHVELDNVAQRLQDGSTACLHCGFPFPGEMTRCPNCGTMLEYHQETVRKNKDNVCYISVLSEEEGSTARWLLQRQFVVESHISPYNGMAPTFKVNILEAYRNFISSDGKTIVSFRRAVSAFNCCRLQYRAETPIKYAPRSRYDYSMTPRYCDISWNGVVNGELEAELDRRLSLRTKS